MNHALLFFIAVFPLVAPLYPDWRTERWTLEPFSGQYGGGAGTGPVEDAGIYSSFADVQVKYPGRMCEDGLGNRYFENSGIQIIYPDGMSETIIPMANLTAGFLDGPSRIARFKVGSYLGNWNYGCDRNGDLYVDDGGNQRIRKIYKDGEGRWMVKSLAGGGTQSPSIGASCAVSQFKTGFNIIVAVNSLGQVHLAAGGLNKIYKVSGDEQSITTLDSLKRDGNSTVNVVDADADSVGNVYFITRQPGRLIKVDSSGAVTRFDVSAYFESIPTCVAAAPDGKCVYLASSKNMQLRRFPMTGEDPVSILCTDGRFHDFNPSGSSIELDGTRAAFTDSSAARFAFIAQLHGHDAQGNLYVSAHGWEAYGISKGAQGLCPTRIAKLVRHDP